MVDSPFKIGDRLYASCSGDFYGEVVGVGKDGNGIPTIDVKIFRPKDLIDFPDAESESGGCGNKEWPNFTGLTSLEIVGDAYLVLRHLQWKYSEHIPIRSPQGYVHDGYTDTGVYVVCLTPGSGCYRCTKLFQIYRPEDALPS